MQSSEGESAQNRKYNGKEFIEAYGLDEYDSYARYYYPAIMRTTTPDPLAEKYYDLSPYAWCGNNPVNFVDPFGLDTINIDGGGNVVSTIKSDEADVINIVEEDEDGNYVVKVDDDGNPISVSFEYGTIESYKSKYSTKDNAKIDWYVIRGDDNAQKAFEIFAMYTCVEWSQLQLGVSGSSGLNVLSTSHTYDKEYGVAFLFRNIYSHKYTIRGHIHSHPHNTPYPSGLNDKRGDIKFASDITKHNEGMGNPPPLLKIFIPKTKEYIIYSKSSEWYHFNTALPEIIITP